MPGFGSFGLPLLSRYRTETPVVASRQPGFLLTGHRQGTRADKSALSLAIHTQTGGSMGDRSRLWLTWAFTAVICGILVASAYVDTHGEAAVFVKIETLVAQLL